MIYKLIPDKYEKVRPLFEELEWNLIVTAVFEETCPGDIYVDDSVNFKTALIVSPEEYYLAGYVHDDEFNRKLEQLFVIL